MAGEMTPLPNPQREIPALVKLYLPELAREGAAFSIAHMDLVQSAHALAMENARAGADRQAAFDRQHERWKQQYDAVLDKAVELTTAARNLLVEIMGVSR